MTKQEEVPSGSASGEHGWTEAVRSLFQSIDATNKVLELVLSTVRWLLGVLILSVLAFAFVSIRSGCQSDERERQLDTLATKLEAMRLQMVTVQATADSTKDSVEVIEDRPFLDSETVSAGPSVSGEAPRLTSVPVIRKPRSPESSQPIQIGPILIPSVPSSAPAPEPKKQ